MVATVSRPGVAARGRTTGAEIRGLPTGARFGRRAVDAAPACGCAQNCSRLSSGDDGAAVHIARVRRWAKGRNLEVRFVASEGPGSHGTLHVDGRKTTVKDRRKEIGRGLLGKMLADLGIDRDDL